MYQTRIKIDTLTLGMAIDAGDEHWEAEILSAFHCMRRQAPKFLENAKEDVAVWHKRKMHFYNALMSACPLKNLLCLQQLLLDRSERYRYLWFYSSANNQSFKGAIDSSERIVDATIARKKDDAMRLLEDHIQHVVNIMSSKLSASQ
jgi:GntR family carbon starvation induced transcriptional regulator